MKPSWFALVVVVVACSSSESSDKKASTDSGTAKDSGTPKDSGVVGDATGSDSSPPKDASTGNDASPVVEAGSDGTTVVDAGPPLDPDGVEMLFPSAAGSSLRLGTADPSSTTGFEIEQDTPITAGKDGQLAYWNLPSHPLNYASGGTGWTTRIHLYASGGKQLYTWKTQNGYLSSPADVKNQELTIFVRVHQILDAQRASVSLKVRGGAHSSSNGDLASCAMLTFMPGSTGTVTRFGKELFHPTYDYVKLTPKTADKLVDGQWIGLKMVSYNDPGDATRVVNRLYVDSDPFDFSTGKPKNNWVEFSEYIDVEGKDTGQYTKLVDWGGWLTTIRTDGFHDIDFAFPSVREIVPPG